MLHFNHDFDQAAARSRTLVMDFRPIAVKARCTVQRGTRDGTAARLVLTVRRVITRQRI